jgi:hypothetical protein
MPSEGDAVKTWHTAIIAIAAFPEQCDGDIAKPINIRTLSQQIAEAVEKAK